MDVTHYQDQEGVQFREIVSKQYNELRDLESEYKKRGNRTWLNLYNACEGKWILTVAIGEK